jgi:hypothetical protein
MIKSWWLTSQVAHAVAALRSDAKYPRYNHRWFRLCHLFLSNISAVKTATQLTAYSAAIFLAASEKVLLAALVGSAGIAVAHRLSEIETKLRARKVGNRLLSQYQSQRGDEFGEKKYADPFRDK